jgi:hypothetical protein
MLSGSFLGIFCMLFYFLIKIDSSYHGSLAKGGVGCSINCRCEGCKNVFGRKDGEYPNVCFHTYLLLSTHKPFSNHVVALNDLTNK